MATEPKYQLVASTLRREIADGIFAEGSLLTTEEELKRRFQVSRQTVRQAIALLEDDGLVVRRRGSGTYVKHGPPPPWGNAYRGRGDYLYYGLHISFHCAGN